MKQTPEHPVYSKNVIEFITVSAEYCSFLENSNQQDRRSFIEKMTKIIPLLYLKTSLLPAFDRMLDEAIQQFVSENEYEFVRRQVVSVVGRYDEYLEVFHPDMQYSDSPVLATISEDLADVYQDLKDMIANFQLADLPIMKTVWKISGISGGKNCLMRSVRYTACCIRKPAWTVPERRMKMRKMIFLA